jgi:predicted O-linked N-acetylglucosamine transferase (SPINDLY family)
VHDKETSYAQSVSTSFEEGARSLAKWVEAILNRQLDVLIYPDIGMEPMTVKLASLRLAPVQMASWGHPETTGLPTMDYYLSAQDLEPSGAQDNYTEQLICLPHLGCCYLPALVDSVPPDFSRLSIDATVPVLLCPGTPFKYAPEHDGIFVDIALALGQCQFIFFIPESGVLSYLSDKLRQRLESAFAEAGLKMSDYCFFIHWQNKAAFYGLMKQADVFLDTIGFSGFNTAMQAIECALPVVTREGLFMRGRLASGILRRMGLIELIVNTKREYVNLVVKLVRDKAYRQDIARRIVTLRPALYGDVEPVRALQDFLLSIVKR